MKQKSGKLQAKSNLKGVQKAQTVKEARKRTTTPAKPLIKNTESKKKPPKIAPKMPIPDEDDEDSDNEVVSLAESEDEISADANDSDKIISGDSDEDKNDEKEEVNSEEDDEEDENENEDEDDDDDEDEEDDENEEKNSEDDQDDEEESPEEAPIAKKDNSKKQTKKPDAKTRPRNEEKVEKKKECSVFVRNLKLDTSQEDIEKHFSSCGGISHAKLVTSRGSRYAFVEFTTIDGAQAALKLHNSNMKGNCISVYLHGDERSKTASKDPKRTVVVKISEKTDNISADVMFKIFKKYGDIENIDIISKTNLLAFVTFKNENSVQKALELHRTIMDGAVMEVKKFQLPGEEKNKRVFMLNVKPGVTEEDLRNFFAETGELEHVTIKEGYAVVKFTDIESFCKSFLQNENLLAGQPVFLEPYSEKKKFALNKPKTGKRKMFPNKNNGRFKKPKKESDEM